MTARVHVLVTDDEPFNLELMEEILEDDYQVDCVASGPECLDFLQNNKPDILLLDVAMPNMNGYEVCQTIKADPNLTLPVLFISARGSLEERLAGYEAGGDDYLVKPFESRELLAKVQSMITFVNKQKQLATQLSQANDITMMVMTSSGEIGNVINFLRQTFECKDLESLTNAVFESLELFGLSGTLQYNKFGQVLATHDTSGLYKPVEAELLQITKSQGRIFNHKSRCIFTFEHAALLIKNMPPMEDEIHGRLLDHLCILMEGVNAQAETIYNLQQVLKDEEKNRALLRDTQQAMTTMKLNLQEQKESALKISQDLLIQVESNLLSLGLEEDQEIFIVEMIEKNIEQMMKCYDNQEKFDVFFNEIIESLNP